MNGPMTGVWRSIDAGSTFTSLKDLPEPRFLHCAAIINNNTLFVAGGSGLTNRAVREHN